MGINEHEHTQTLLNWLIIRKNKVIALSFVRRIYGRTNHKEPKLFYVLLISSKKKKSFYTIIIIEFVFGQWCDFITHLAVHLDRPCISKTIIFHGITHR